MKARNLVLGLMLATNALTAHSAVIATGSAVVAANAVAMSASSTTIASTVSSSMMNSNNSVVVECTLEKEWKEGGWIGTPVASYKETIEVSRCQYNKKTMEQLNNTHYEFGKVKGIFSVGANDHVMIELVQVNE